MPQEHCPAQQDLVARPEEEPVDQEDHTTPALSEGSGKCLLASDPVFVKTKLWVHVHKIDTGIKCTRMLVLEGIKNEFPFSFLRKSVFSKFATRCWKKNNKREIGCLPQRCPTDLGLRDFGEGWSVMAADGQTGSPVRWPFGFTHKRGQGPAASLPSVSILGCGEVGDT